MPDRLDLTPAERDLVEREAANLLDEWFHDLRRREWRAAGARAAVVPALFAVLTHVTDGEARAAEGRHR